MTRSAPPAGGPQQPVAVVEEGEVADQQRGRPGTAEGHPERGGHHTVDAVGAPVGEDGQVRGGRDVALDVPDRHRRRRHQPGPGGERGGDRPGGGGLRPGRAGSRDRAGRRGADGLPAGEPAVRARRAPGSHSASSTAPASSTTQAAVPAGSDQPGAPATISTAPAAASHSLTTRDEPGGPMRTIASGRRASAGGGRAQHGVEVGHRGGRRPPGRRAGLGHDGPAEPGGDRVDPLAVDGGGRRPRSLLAGRRRPGARAAGPVRRRRPPPRGRRPAPGAGARARRPAARGTGG